MSETPPLSFRAPGNATAGYVSFDIGLASPSPGTYSSSDPASCGQVVFCIATTPNPPPYLCGEYAADSCPKGCGVFGPVSAPQCDWTESPLCYVALSEDCNPGVSTPGFGTWTLTLTSVAPPVVLSGVDTYQVHGTVTARVVPETGVDITEGPNDATFTMTI